mmetsp:Transcript_34793/g.84676  ORF Transcript_34793/g.84676 Transcript_34793/m.84676 type:complete len:459 (-) Transcript_34793:459-1835(-)
MFQSDSGCAPSTQERKEKARVRGTRALQNGSRQVMAPLFTEQQRKKKAVMDENPAHSKNLKKPTKSVDKPDKKPKNQPKVAKPPVKGPQRAPTNHPRSSKTSLTTRTPPLQDPHTPAASAKRSSDGRATPGQRKVRRHRRALRTPREEGQVRLGKVRKDLSEPGGDLNWVMDISPVTPQAHRGGNGNRARDAALHPEPHELANAVRLLPQHVRFEGTRRLVLRQKVDQADEAGLKVSEGGADEGNKGPLGVQRGSVARVVRHLGVLDVLEGFRLRGAPFGRYCTRTFVNGGEGDVAHKAARGAAAMCSGNLHLNAQVPTVGVGPREHGNVHAALVEQARGKGTVTNGVGYEVVAAGPRERRNGPHEAGEAVETPVVPDGPAPAEVALVFGHVIFGERPREVKAEPPAEPQTEEVYAKTRRGWVGTAREGQEAHWRVLDDPRPSHQAPDKGAVLLLLRW